MNCGGSGRLFRESFKKGKLAAGCGELNGSARWSDMRGVGVGTGGLVMEGRVASQEGGAVGKKRRGKEGL